MFLHLNSARKRGWKKTALLVFGLLLSFSVFSDPPPAKDLIDIEFSSSTDLRDLAAYFSRLTGKNIMVDQQLTGKIQIFAPTKVTKEEGYQAFLASLQMAGFSVVETGKVTKIIRAQEAIKSGSSVVSPGKFKNTGGQVVTLIYPLKNTDSNKIRLALAKFVSVNALLSFTPTNSLIICDYDTDIVKILKLLKLLDVPADGNAFERVVIHHANVDDIAKKLKEIELGPKRSEQTAANSFIADIRTNSIAIFGSGPYINSTKQHIATFDVEAESASDKPHFYVRPIDFSNARKLSTTLNGFSEVASFAGKAQSKDKVVITAEEATNTLLIKANKSEYHQLQRILRRLDQRRDQVFIEVVLLELSSTSDFKFGASAFLGISGSSAKTPKTIIGWESGILQPTIAAQATAQPVDQSAKALGQVVNDGFATGVLAPAVDLPGIGKISPAAFLKMMQEDSGSVVLSKPYIYTSENEEASISVGETIYYRSVEPTITGVAQVKFEKEDASTVLKVKPTVHLDDYVSLDLNLEFKVLTKITDQGLPEIAKRTIKQNVMAKTDQTIVLAGLKRRDQLSAIRKVPLLGDLPLIGNFLQTKTQEVYDIRLMVFLTPHIIGNLKDLSRIYREKLSSLPKGADSLFGGETNENNFLSDLPGIAGEEFQESAFEKADEQRRQMLRRETLEEAGYLEKLH